MIQQFILQAYITFFCSLLIASPLASMVNAPVITIQTYAQPIVAPVTHNSHYHCPPPGWSCIYGASFSTCTDPVAHDARTNRSTHASNTQSQPLPVIYVLPISGKTPAEEQRDQQRVIDAEKKFMAAATHDEKIIAAREWVDAVINKNKTSIQWLCDFCKNNIAPRSIQGMEELNKARQNLSSLESEIRKAQANLYNAQEAKKQDDQKKAAEQAQKIKAEQEAAKKQAQKKAHEEAEAKRKQQEKLNAEKKAREEAIAAEKARAEAQAAQEAKKNQENTQNPQPNEEQQLIDAVVATGAKAFFNIVIDDVGDHLKNAIDHPVATLTTIALAAAAPEALLAASLGVALGLYHEEIREGAVSYCNYAYENPADAAAHGVAESINFVIDAVALHGASKLTAPATTTISKAVNHIADKITQKLSADTATQLATHVATEGLSPIAQKIIAESVEERLAAQALSNAEKKILLQEAAQPHPTPPTAAQPPVGKNPAVPHSTPTPPPSVPTPTKTAAQGAQLSSVPVAQSAGATVAATQETTSLTIFKDNLLNSDNNKFKHIFGVSTKSEAWFAHRWNILNLTQEEIGSKIICIIERAIIDGKIPDSGVFTIQDKICGHIIEIRGFVKNNIITTNTAFILYNCC